MWSFFVDLVRNADVTRTVVVMDSEKVGKARRYRIRPRRMVAAWGGSLFAVGLVVAILFAFTPLGRVIPGAGTEQVQERARLNAMRVRALQDSVAAQRHYIERLRRLITGRVDSMPQPGRVVSSESPATTGQPRRRPEQGGTDSAFAQGDHVQPALAPSSVLASGPALSSGKSVSSGLSFPVDPPVPSGFPTRDFDAQTGHYGIDVAVSEGVFVRAVGEGYVVLADWTQDAGYTIAVQHANGYLSVYKHNKRLLKQRGDRVRAQEPLAVSGNTGAITTGPHLHFELWRKGLAQDPRSYIAGW